MNTTDTQRARQAYIQMVTRLHAETEAAHEDRPSVIVDLLERHAEAEGALRIMMALGVVGLDEYRDRHRQARTNMRDYLMGVMAQLAMETASVDSSVATTIKHCVDGLNVINRDYGAQLGIVADALAATLRVPSPRVPTPPTQADAEQTMTLDQAMADPQGFLAGMTEKRYIGRRDADGQVTYEEIPPPWAADAGTPG